MLLPFRMPSEASQQHQQQSLPRLQYALLASPPISPPTTYIQPVPRTMPSGGLGSPFQPTFAPLPQLPTPPMAYAVPPFMPKFKVKCRARPESAPRMKLARRAPATPTEQIIFPSTPRGGANKRRRDDDDDEQEQNYTAHVPACLGDPFVAAIPSQTPTTNACSRARFTTPEPEARPCSSSSSPRTPKRARIAPESLPLGLERADFHELHDAKNDQRSNMVPDSLVETESDGSQWSVEDDRLLVEVVLAKFNLTKEQWAECASVLGKERSGLDKRWKTLTSNNEVGLRPKLGRRSRLHSTWA